jgi:hypothetical protein
MNLTLITCNDTRYQPSGPGRSVLAAVGVLIGMTVSTGSPDGSIAT